MVQKQNTELNLKVIKPLDLTSKLQGIQGTEDMLQKPTETQSTKSQCGKLQRTKDLVFSTRITNHKNKKGQIEVNLQSERDFMRYVKQLKDIDFIYNLIQENRL